MDLSAEARIAQVQSQAKGQVGESHDLARGEQIAEVSHYGSMAVGLGVAAKGGWVGVAAYGAAIAGGYAGGWLSEKLGMPDLVADGLEALGMHRIGQGGPHPATVGHQVAHSNAFAGFLAAIVVGVVAAVAVGALIVATGGAAAVVLIGAAAAGGFAGGFLGSALGGALAQTGTRTGPIVMGSPDVFIEGRPAARMTDMAACSKESVPQPIIEGSETIFVNGLPMSRIGHKLLCGAVVDEGVSSVFTDETTIACAQPAPDIPVWARVAADWLGFLPLGKAMAMLSNRSRSAQASGRPQACRTCASDPVDVASGEFVEWRTDIAVPGALPLALRRHYASRREAAGRPSLFGPRWVDSWSVSLQRGRHGAATIDYHDDEGVSYTFDTPDDVLQAEHLVAPHLVLRGTREAPVLHDRQRGEQLHFEWCGDLARLSAIGDASGNRIEFVYERSDHGAGPERLAGLQHSDGWTLRLQWLEGLARTGQLRSAWLHEPDRPPVELVRYQHDEHGRLVHAASQSSGRLGYRYDAAHRITLWGDDSETRVHVSYDEHGRVAQVDTPGHLHSGRFEYDREARLTRVWTTPSTAEAHLDPHAAQPAQPSLTVYHYNEDELVTQTVDPLGHTTQTGWDRLRHVTSSTDELGRTTRFEHDEAGRLVAQTDARGRTTELAYDAEGRLQQVTDALGRSSSATYDAAGRVLSQRSADGSQVAYVYDTRGRLREEHWGPPGAQQVVLHHHDEQHRPCGHTAPNGGHTAWRQDRLGRIDWQTDPVGATTVYEYPERGRPDEPGEAPRAGGHLQPLRTVAADGSVVEQQYTVEGLPSRRTDASGHTQTWAWGAFDLLAAHTDERGHVTQYRYGAQARLVELQNPLGQTWQWHFDAAGRLAAQTDYAGRRTRWERDAAGRPLARHKPDGSVLRYHWDDADRVFAIDGGDARIGYDYDERDQLVRARVWRVQGTTAVLESDLRLAHDDAGRLTEETHQGEHGPLRRIAYRYDAQGRLLARDGPLGETVYQHDALGLLRELHTAHGSVHIERDLLGRETERASRADASPEMRRPHFRLHQQRDKLGRLTEQRADSADPLHTVQRRYHWQHERLTGIDDARFGSVRWQLDARDQIEQTKFDPSQTLPTEPAMLANATRSFAHHRQEDTRYGYDAAGNLASQHGEPLRYRDDTVTEFGGNRYEWDACGRLTRRIEQRPGFRPRSWQFAWDGFDRLKAVITPDGQRWRYAYDALGRRRSKRCESPAAANDPRRPRRRELRQAEYLWDGPTLAAQWKRYADGSSEAPATASTSASFIAPASVDEDVQEWHFEPGSFAPLAIVQRQGLKATKLLHVVGDLNGAPREVLGNDGELLWAAQLDTWGQLARCHVKDQDRAYASRFGVGHRPAANDPAVEIELRFANQWEDEESGLFYNLNRYYDPETAQYASQDPLGPAGGARTHGYVHNPVTWVDPLGLAGCPLTDLNAQATSKVGKVTAPIDFDGHILSGEIKPNGSVVGGHSIATGNVKVVPGTASVPNSQGVYKAQISVYDSNGGGQYVRKTNNGGVSTMFPDSWSADRVKVEVDAAYQTRAINGNMWTGTTPSGVLVKGYLNPKTTVYPIY